MRVIPKTTSQIQLGRCPSKTSSNAAIFIPAQAPGIVSVNASNRSLLAKEWGNVNSGFLMLKSKLEPAYL